MESFALIQNYKTLAVSLFSFGGQKVCHSRQMCIFGQMKVDVQRGMRGRKKSSVVLQQQRKQNLVQVQFSMTIIQKCLLLAAHIVTTKILLYLKLVPFLLSSFFPSLAPSPLAITFIVYCHEGSSRCRLNSCERSVVRVKCLYEEAVNGSTVMQVWHLLYRIQGPYSTTEIMSLQWMDREGSGVASGLIVIAIRNIWKANQKCFYDAPLGVFIVLLFLEVFLRINLAVVCQVYAHCHQYVIAGLFGQLKS